MPEDKPITTLDEAIEKLYPLDDPRKNMFHDNPVQYIRREAFKNGAEWQSQQKETKPTGLRKLIDIRNKFYHNLPTRDIKSWDLLQHIKSHLKDIDNYINQHTTTSEETEETKPVEEYKNPLKEMEEEIKEANFTENDFPTKPVEDKADVIVSIITEYKDGRDCIPKGLSYREYQIAHTKLLQDIYDKNIEPPKPVSEEGGNK